MIRITDPKKLTVVSATVLFSLALLTSMALLPAMRIPVVEAESIERGETQIPSKSLPALSNSEKEEFIEIARNIQGVKEWSESDGSIWEWTLEASQNRKRNGIMR